MNWLRNFMIGRYGLDQLNIALLAAMMFCTLASSLSGSLILYLLSLIFMVLAIFRLMSRNHSSRVRENEKFLIFWNAVKRGWNRIRGWFAAQKRRFADRKTHRYYRCPNCKKQLRVPKGRGKIEISCPICHTKFIKKT